MEEKWIAHVGPHKVDIRKAVRDPRGIEDRVKEILEKDFVESRYAQFGASLNIMPDAADLEDWDRSLLERYEPLYGGTHDTCTDCELGPCQLKQADGKCGLKLGAFQGKLSLRKACRGCVSQMVVTRHQLNYALKLWKEDTPISMGDLLTMSDTCPPVGLVSGIYVKTLKDLNLAVSYGESQLGKLMAAAYSGTGETLNFESMAMHAGSILMLAMGASEMLKVSCFGFLSAAKQKIDELENFPPAKATGGWASIQAGKPVIAFAGDDFLPAWCAIDYLKRSESLDKVEICGIGPAGDDIIRFYEKGHILAPMVRAGKAIRNGVFDVLVAGIACMPLDLASEAARVDSRFIWVGSQGVAGLVDKTDDSVDKIVAGLVGGEKAAWIRDVEKAAEVAVKVAQAVKRNQVGLLSDEAAVAEAKKCKPDCDLCSMSCPNSLPVSKAVRSLQGGQWEKFFEVEKGCYFCGKCESACPAKVELRDIVVAAERKQAGKDKFVMRAGRGPLPLTEILQSAFSMVWGNAPGIVIIAGCGDAPKEEIGWLAYELTRRNCIVFTAGCGAAELGRHYIDSKGKYLFETYLSSIEPRSLINCGGCAAMSLANNMYMYSRAAGGIPLYGGIPEVGEGSLYTTFSLLLWGAVPDRMYAVAAAYARLGIRVVVGPTSGWTWGRYLPGDRYDRSKWWVYHGDDGRKRETEPVPEHLLVPVETKEEALTMIPRMFFSTSEMREGRAARMDFFLELYRIFYNEMPPDWNLLVRSHLDIPMRHRLKLIKVLRDEFGWEGDGLKLTKARNRDGKLLTLSEFNTSYGMELGRYHCRLKRLLPNSVKQKQKDA
jgi:acetyl-CoA decarbonylase/synthase complex subunit alpha